MFLKSLIIEVCCSSQTRIQESNAVLQIRSLFVASKILFRVSLSGDTSASLSGLAVVGVALGARADTALTHWMPINCQLCTVRLESSIKLKINRCRKRCFLVIVYASKDCSPDRIKDKFHYQLSVLLQKMSSTDILVPAGDLNAQVGGLGTKESCLGGQ